MIGMPDPGTEPELSPTASATAALTTAFTEDTQRAVHGLRRALAEMLTSVDADPDQPQEISRRFGLDKTLTWRITRVIRAEDPWEAVPHIPRRPSIGILVRAMTKHGAPSARVESVVEALDRFERCVELHSGDRETLEMMLGAGATRANEKRMEAFRKSGFQANSAIWGVQARIQLAVRIASPSRKDPSLVDLTTVTGLVDFRRLRPDVPWAVATLTAWKRTGELDTSKATTALEMLDEQARQERDVLMRRFCSANLPEIHPVEFSPGQIRYMLGPGPVGNTAAATAISGWINRASGPVRASEPDENLELGVSLSTPVEELLHDVLIHRDLHPLLSRPPTVRVFSMLPGGPEYPTAGVSASSLPVPTDVTSLGSLPPDTTTPQVPRYRELVEMMTQRLELSLDDFHGFRYRLRYPPIPTIAVTALPLGAPGE